MSEEKTEKKRKTGKWPTYLGHLGPTYRSSSPGPPGPLSSSPSAASTSLEGMPTPPTPPGHAAASPPSSACPGEAPGRPRHFPHRRFVSRHLLVSPFFPERLRRSLP